MNKASFSIAAVSILIFTTLFTFSTKAQQWVSDLEDSTLTLEQKSAAFNSFWNGKEYERGNGYKQFKRIEDFLQGRVGSDGKFNPPSDRYTDYKMAQQEMSNLKGLGAAGKWTHLGPNGPSSGTGSGRINCIDFHPTNSNKIIIGAPAGGIWRSDNGGSSWTTNTDDLASIGISDIKYAPSNASIIYAATGDIDGDDTYTHGILKSTNGGNTWTVTSWAYNYSSRKKTYRLLVHPTNADIVYASTNLGFFKTTDGGQNWVRKRLGVFKDIEFKPGDPNTIYLASGSRISKTTDAGQTFTNLKSFSGTSRLEIGVTPADPTYVYVLAGNSNGGGFNGLYLSTNSGVNFTTKSTSPNILGWKKNGSDTKGQAWYDLSLAVSPTNKNKLYVGGINMWTSNNGGTSWSMAAYWLSGQGYPYVHADIHMLKYNPNNNSHIWACTDGGVSKSTNGGGAWNEKNTNLAVAQMYRLGASKTNANKVMTGWQDNGSSFMSPNWNYVLGGDGMECIISHYNNAVIYASLYNGDIRRSYNSGASFSKITTSISEPGAWTTPFIMDKNNSSILLAGYSNVWKTTNKGNSWSKKSSWGSSNNPINALAATGPSSSIIWAANSSSLHKTTNGGSSWTTITANIGSNNVNSIAINIADPNKVWVCKSGFTQGQKVYQTLDGGTTWTNISGSLPNYPINTIVNAANTANGLYVGTDIGVYYYDTNLGDWIPFMKKLPNVIVKELEIFEQGNKIRAATFGRGLWESVTYPFANSISTFKKNEIKVNIYPNPANNMVNIDFITKLPKDAKLTILNSTGRIIDENISLNDIINTINISKYAKGIYLFKITTTSQVSVNKIIIE